MKAIFKYIVLITGLLSFKETIGQTTDTLSLMSKKWVVANMAIDSISPRFDTLANSSEVILSYMADTVEFFSNGQMSFKQFNKGLDSASSYTCNWIKINGFSQLDILKDGILMNQIFVLYIDSKRMIYESALYIEDWRKYMKAKYVLVSI